MNPNRYERESAIPRQPNLYSLWQKSIIHLINFSEKSTIRQTSLVLPIIDSQEEGVNQPYFRPNGMRSLIKFQSGSTVKLASLSINGGCRLQRTVSPVCDDCVEEKTLASQPPMTRWFEELTNEVQPDERSRRPTPLVDCCWLEAPPQEQYIPFHTPQRYPVTAHHAPHRMNYIGRLVFLAQGLTECL